MTSADALVSALVFLAAGLAGVLAADGLALAVFAEAGTADLLAEADVFVTGSSFPKCVIHRLMS
ncbi:hypothetical protein JY96_02350 [Aquabacterium sp. NJ1]|nr:hypothetical protein JY96_02350 [Aquabacterium sp. NJ1]